MRRVGQEKEGQDHKDKMSIVETSSLNYHRENVRRVVRRICALILKGKGLKG